MKYINQVNWILVIVAGAVVVSTLVNTFWHPDNTVVTSIEIPKGAPASTEDLRGPVPRTPQPGDSPARPLALEQPNPPALQPAVQPPVASPAPGLSSNTGQNPGDPGRPNVLTIGAAPRAQGDRAVDPVVGANDGNRPPQSGRPMQAIQGSTRYELSAPPPPTAPKRSAGSDPAAPPIRSSMSEQGVRY